MILVVCRSCGKGLRISPGHVSDDMSQAFAMFGPGSDMYPDRFPCFSCEGKAELVMHADSMAVSALELHDVTPDEAVAAFHGLGLPEEQECSAAAVNGKLVNAQITKVQVRQIRNSHRSVLDWIQLSDGTRLYLGASSHGAVVYRISTIQKYAERV